uniref:Uncharacterized protein n=1 Tax=Ditylenchus dipsaci TaxID=166011 RepID=A0A915ESQ0_9BILA
MQGNVERKVAALPKEEISMKENVEKKNDGRATAKTSCYFQLEGKQSTFATGRTHLETSETKETEDLSGGKTQVLKDKSSNESNISLDVVLENHLLTQNHQSSSISRHQWRQPSSEFRGHVHNYLACMLDVPFAYENVFGSYKEVRSLSGSEQDSEEDLPTRSALKKLQSMSLQPLQVPFECALGIQRLTPTEKFTARMGQFGKEEARQDIYLETLPNGQFSSIVFEATNQQATIDEASKLEKIQVSSHIIGGEEEKEDACVTLDDSENQKVQLIGQSTSHREVHLEHSFEHHEADLSAPSYIQPFKASECELLRTEASTSKDVSVEERLEKIITEQNSKLVVDYQQLEKHSFETAKASTSWIKQEQAFEVDRVIANGLISGDNASIDCLSVAQEDVAVDEQLTRIGGLTEAVACAVVPDYDTSTDRFQAKTPSHETVHWQGEFSQEDYEEIRNNTLKALSTHTNIRLDTKASGQEKIDIKSHLIAAGDVEEHEKADAVVSILSSTFITTSQLQQSKEEDSNWEGGMDREEVEKSTEAILSDNTCGTANLNAEACKTQKCTVNSQLVGTEDEEGHKVADMVFPILGSTLKTTSQLQQSKEEDSNWQGDMCQKEETNESTELLFPQNSSERAAWTPELAQHKKTL